MTDDVSNHDLRHETKVEGTSIGQGTIVNIQEAFHLLIHSAPEANHQEDIIQTNILPMIDIKNIQEVQATIAQDRVISGQKDHQDPHL